MTRSEVVAFFSQVVLVCGDAGIAALVADRYLIRGLPELHDPEFTVCMECGAEFELPFNGQARGGYWSRKGEFCGPCQDVHRTSMAALKRREAALCAAWNLQTGEAA